MTFSIRGPFRRSDTKRQQQMAVATPPEFIRAKISGELAEAVGRLGMSTLEAAAYDPLGVSLV
jgi:hypothetical protein